MSNLLMKSVFRILGTNNQVVGTGFLVTQSLGITCAHIVQAIGKKPGDDLCVQFHLDDTQIVVNVSEQGWRNPEDGDIAVLRFITTLPNDKLPVILGKSDLSLGNDYIALGYPNFNVIETRWPRGKIGGKTRVNGQDYLDIQGQEIRKGMSGAPVFDLVNKRVVGMISFYVDENEIFNRFTYAVPSETLANEIPGLRLWPAIYGPDEWRNYLEYLVSVNKQLSLPDKRKVPLEKLYISLRADAMNAAERKAEYDLYLQERENLRNSKSNLVLDPYLEHKLTWKALILQPKMQMLNSREWDAQFSSRQQEKVNLAEVVRRHPCVVLLGDPGSGKTTLGRWLTLQQSTALLECRSELSVPLDLVQPGITADFVESEYAEEDQISLSATSLAHEPLQHEVAEGDGKEPLPPMPDTRRKRNAREVNLGSPKLTVFVRIINYARARWQKDNPDNGLDLFDFILGGQFNEYTLPSNLASKSIGALCCDTINQGNALVIFDGLDEVGDPDQRRIVMQNVNEFIDKYYVPGNRIILTSRIVGYQFQPLTHLPHYTVDEMDEKAIQAFCQAWMTYFHTDGTAEENGEKLSKSILEYGHPGVRALAGNPLMLTLLAQVYRSCEAQELPHRRVDLFAETLAVFYKQRKHLYTDKIEENQLAYALSAVAYQLHISEHSDYIDRGAVLASLLSVLPTRDQAETVLQIADEAIGFLVSRGEGIYGFLHRALQEYFVSLYLTEDPKRVSQLICEHALDPTWREPLTMAIGIIGQSGKKCYPVPNQMAFIENVWRDILESPDPAGDVLPRRALLLATAAGECELFPQKSLGNVIGQLLLVYGGRVVPVLRERIRRAFNSMRLGETKDLVDAALCDYLSSSNQEYRWAAADLIIETQWESISIVHALINALINYPTPTGAVLVALNNINNHHPEYFLDEFLPLRLALKNSIEMQNCIQNNKAWQIVIETLYLYPGQEIDFKNIWRDSSLTPDILARLQNNEDFQGWIPELLSISEKIDTPRGRDAALILAGIGEITPEIYKITQDVNSSLPKGFIAGLEFLVSFANDIVPYRNRQLTTALNITSRLGLGNIRAPIYSISKFLGLKNSVARDLVIFAKKGPSALDSHRTLALARAINNSLDYDNGVDEKEIEDVNESDILISRARVAISGQIRHVITLNDLVIALSNAVSPIKDFTNEKNFDYVRVLDRNSAFDVDDFIDESIDHFIDVEEIRLKVVNGLKKKNITKVTKQQLKLCMEMLAASEIVQLPRWITSNNIVKGLIKRSKFISKATKSLTSKINLAEISPEEIVSCLSSQNDNKRYAILKALETPPSARQLGRNFLEKIAKLAIQYSDQPQIGTQLSWTLNNIEYNCLDWIREWIEIVANSAVKNVSSPEGDLLQSVYIASLDVEEGLLELLPHKSKQVNENLLHSLMWQAALGKIPTPLVFEKLRDWLFKEKDADIVNRLIDILGHWHSEPATALRFLLEWNPSDSARPAWFNALARLGRIVNDNELRILAHEHLIQGIHEYSYATSALVRFFLNNEKDYIARLQNFIPDINNLFSSIIIAGTDSDIWIDEYHKVLVKAIQDLAFQYPEQIIPVLIMELRKSLTITGDNAWPRRRFMLASVAACIEIMPTEMQRVSGGPQALESLLIDGSKDSGSFNSRRFAINALGYLRVVSSSIVPVLINGLQENVEIVQTNTIDTVSRFQRFQGDVLSELSQYLTVGDATATMYGVAKLLGAIGMSPAAEIASIRPQIIQYLADAIRHPNSQQDVVLLRKSLPENHLETISAGKLSDHLAQEMLRVAGWL